MIGKLLRSVLAPLGALVLMGGVASAAKVTIAVGGAGCLCYLPTMLAERASKVLLRHGEEGHPGASRIHSHGVYQAEG